MLPDFKGLRQQTCNSADLRSLKPRSDALSSESQSFQQFHKHRDRGADNTIFCGANHTFFHLWLVQPSWSPIILGKHGWQTVKNNSGKKVPLTLGSIESHFRREIVIGKRFGKLTNYLLIDVDTGSPFHPRNGGLEPILSAMESLGLCRYLLIRSSGSGGLHVYFPLAESVSAWGLACAAHAALTAAGVTIAGGICELFPNKKAFNAEHNGHRLPLQDSSFILDDDFRCISNSKTVFLQQWQLCAAQQDEALLAELLTEKPVAIPKQIAVSSLPPIAWTASGQSNEVMKQLVNYGDRYLGLNTIPSLGDWMVAVAPQLSGFTQFASEESRNDLTRRDWAYRWAKSHFKSVRQYAAKTSFDHNAMVAAEALERLMVALDNIVVSSKLGIGKLWKALSAISKNLFGVGFSWGLFQKHRKLILKRIESSRNLGLSRRTEEGKSSSVSEGTKPLNPEPKKHLTELLTLRCMTSRNDKALNASRTPSNQEAKRGRQLAMGATVSCQMTDDDVDAVETRIIGKEIQCEEHAEGKSFVAAQNGLEGVADESELRSQVAPAQPQEGVIRATAAQLLQVMGNACPFVGPGLWTIRREDMTAKDWSSLERLTESEGAIGEASIV